MVFATESLAAPLVQEAGYLTEYITSRKYSDLLRDRWNHYYHRRLLHLISCHRPDLVAYDGVVPYSGLLRGIEDNPDVTWVWIRRAMWKAGKGQEWIARGKHFDHILEPGDFSEAVDGGVTVPDRAAAHRVGPITFLDRDDLLPPAEARQALGLAGDDPTALLQLGAGNINSVQTIAGGIAAHLMDKGVRIVVAQSPIARTALDVPAGATVVNLYPLSRYLHAFHFAVSAAGYNSFHELINFGVPTVFLPNENTAYDDQVTRVRYAAELGVARWLPDPFSAESLEPILDPVVQKALSERCLELSPPNGAQAAADWIEELVSRPRSGA